MKNLKLLLWFNIKKRKSTFKDSNNFLSKIEKILKIKIHLFLNFYQKKFNFQFSIKDKTSLKSFHCQEIVTSERILEFSKAFQTNNNSLTDQ